MAGIQVQIKGLEQLRAKLKGLPREAQKAFDAALMVEATGIMTAAQKTVPVDTGRLRSGGRVTAERSGGRIAITIAYGAPYAGYVHAKTNWADGRAYKPTRWLAKAAEKASKTIAGRLIRAVRNSLKGTGYGR